ncbi:hypothetical protein BJP24_02205 [Aeromonas allosaccharophila]|nr:hypothetical protein BJP24_02205 [Aeromonas allosaccharophila]
MIASYLYGNFSGALKPVSRAVLLPIFRDFQGLAISENLFMSYYFYLSINVLIKKGIFVFL